MGRSEGAWRVPPAWPRAGVEADAPGPMILELRSEATGERQCCGAVLTESGDLVRSEIPAALSDEARQLCDLDGLLGPWRV